MTPQGSHETVSGWARHAQAAQSVGPLTVNQKMQIAGALTARLRERTGDPAAERTVVAVQVRINLIGLQSGDVLGGITELVENERGTD